MHVSLLFVVSAVVIVSGNNWREGDASSLTRQDDKQVASSSNTKSMKGAETPWYHVRLGRAPRDYVRLGRSPRDFVRLGRSPRDYVRLGRSPRDYVRLGRSPRDYVRLGRAAAARGYVRFGRPVDNQVDHSEKSHPPVESEIRIQEAHPLTDKEASKYDVLGKLFKERASYKTDQGRPIYDKSEPENNEKLSTYYKPTNYNLSGKNWDDEIVKLTNKNYIRMGKLKDPLAPDFDQSMARIQTHVEHNDKRAGSYVRMGRVAKDDTNIRENKVSKPDLGVVQRVEQKSEEEKRNKDFVRMGKREKLWGLENRPMFNTNEEENKQGINSRFKTDRGSSTNVDSQLKLLNNSEIQWNLNAYPFEQKPVNNKALGKMKRASKLYVRLGKKSDFGVDQKRANKKISVGDKAIDFSRVEYLNALKSDKKRYSRQYVRFGRSSV